MLRCCFRACSAEADGERKSDMERKLSTEIDTPRRLQPASFETSTTSSCTSTPATSGATADTAASDDLVGMFDDFDWDLDSAESLQCLSEEDLKKRHSVMIEKVRQSLYRWFQWSAKMSPKSVV